jgi:3-phenylpropionate/trans-cinnamate dioxygenase ferredoxin subunit
MSPRQYVAVARVGEIAEGGRKIVRIEDQEVAIFLIEGGYYAIDDVCTHDGGPIGEGTLEGDIVECPRHGARFSVRTGAAVAMPATSPVNRLKPRARRRRASRRWRSARRWKP